MTLLAVSKRQPVAKIREAAARLRDFGENYLQEAIEKQQQLEDLPKLIWHFIGPIQSNKTREFRKISTGCTVWIEAK